MHSEKVTILNINANLLNTDESGIQIKAIKNLLARKPNKKDNGNSEYCHELIIGYPADT
jgi:hypothetical protein